MKRRSRMTSSNIRKNTIYTTGQCSVPSAQTERFGSMAVLSDIFDDGRTVVTMEPVCSRASSARQLNAIFRAASKEGRGLWLQHFAQEITRLLGKLHSCRRGELNVPTLSICFETAGHHANSSTLQSRNQLDSICGALRPTGIKARRNHPQ